ncbi:MAG TPA: GNAT family N-acetyltransferase [Conexibacter sp.]|jgi:phosphinothricin acetyltransferase
MARPADPSRDAAACAAIYAPFVADTAVTFDEQAPDAATMAATIETLSRTHAFLVAERDGRVAGYAYAGPHRERAAYRWATTVTIYLDPAFHRQGIGRELYSELFERLRQRGFLIAAAGITLPNDASVGLHESFGFELVGIYRSIGWKAGAWRDVGWWQLQLAEPDATPPTEPR